MRDRGKRSRADGSLMAKQIPQVGPNLFLSGMALADVGVGVDGAQQVGEAGRGAARARDLGPFRTVQGDHRGIVRGREWRGALVGGSARSGAAESTVDAGGAGRLCFWKLFLGRGEAFG